MKLMTEDDARLLERYRPLGGQARPVVVVLPDDDWRVKVLPPGGYILTPEYVWVSETNWPAMRAMLIHHSVEAAIHKLQETP